MPITCPHCQLSFVPADPKAGEPLTCPRCTHVIILPAAAQPGAPAGLRIRDKTHNLTDPGRACPSCGATMPTQDEICTACGHNTRTGKKERTRRPIPWRRWITNTATWLLIALAAAYGWMHREAIRHQLKARIQRLRAHEPDANLIAAEQKAREQILALLNQKYPLFQEGEAVELRLKSGRLLHGVYMKEENGACSVSTEPDNQTVVTPLSDLDEPTRIRCSEAERNRFMELRLNQYMTEAAKQAQNTKPVDVLEKVLGF